MAIVHLYGNLAEKFNPIYKLNIDSPREAVSALCNLVPGFKRELSIGSYYLYVGDINNPIVVDEDNFSFKFNDDIHILPEVVGAKSGLGKLLVGILMIGLAFIPGVNVLAAGMFGISSAAAGSIMLGVRGIGTMLALGGASRMLSNKTKGDKQDQNFTFSNFDQTVQQGNAVPLVYGEFLAQGIPVSFEMVGYVQSMWANPHYDYSGTWGIVGAAINDLTAWNNYYPASSTYVQPDTYEYNSTYL